jgi:hypothetical protein
MIEPTLTSIEVAIKDRFRVMSSMHISLCVDILQLMREETQRGRTYVDMLKLANVLQRNLDFQFTEKR